MTFIEKISKIMEMRGISAYRIYKDLGISQSTFSTWKSGKTEPTISKAIQLLQYFEVNPNEIFGIDTSKDLLTETEKELLEIFQRMDERHQLRAIGILEDYADKHPAEQESNIVSTSKIG